MSDEGESSIALLREIRDQQRRQIEKQEEALIMQREMMRLAKENVDRAERLQGRAEKMQEKARKFLGVLMAVAIPAVILLLVLALWPTLARMFG